MEVLIAKYFPRLTYIVEKSTSMAKKVNAYESNVWIDVAIRFIIISLLIVIYRSVFFLQKFNEQFLSNKLTIG